MSGAEIRDTCESLQLYHRLSPKLYTSLLTEGKVTAMRDLLDIVATIEASTVVGDAVQVVDGLLFG